MCPTTASTTTPTSTAKPMPSRRIASSVCAARTIAPPSGADTARRCYAHRPRRTSPECDVLEWLLAAALLAGCNPAEAVTIVAHRGGMDSAFTETTLAAFRSAAAGGADAAELDVRATRDGVFVVLHDARVDRTTLGRGRVARLTAQQVRRLATPDGLRIPELGQVLGAELGMTLVLDLKAARLDLAALVERV